MKTTTKTTETTETTTDERIDAIRNDPLLMQVVTIQQNFSATMGQLLDVVLQLTKDVETLKKAGNGE